MPEILESLVPFLVGGLSLLAALLFVVALWYFRRGRREPYWRMRRSASLHGWELFLVSLTMAFVAAAICLFSGFAQAILEGPDVTNDTTETTVPSLTPLVITATAEPATATPAAVTTTIQSRLSATPTPTLTPATDESPTPAPSVQPAETVTSSSPSPTASPSSTPSPTEPVVHPLESRITPLPEAVLEITAVDSAVTGDLQPVNRETPADSGITRIYFWVRYSGLTDGVAWERLLLSEGIVVQGGAYLWSGGEAGENVFFFGEADGFGPGTYEIRLSLGGDGVASQVFTLE